jgi:hypothetical protein
VLLCTQSVKYKFPNPSTVARPVQGDPDRGAERGRGGCGAVAAEALLAGSGNRGDDAAYVDVPDTLVSRIGDIQVSGGIQGHALGPQQHRFGGLPVVAAVSKLTRSGNRGDDPAGGDPADCAAAG